MKNPSLWLAALSLIAACLSAYVGLKLEPIAQQLNTITIEVRNDRDTNRAIINDYIQFKAQTLEILRQQNRDMDRLEAQMRRRP